MTNSQYDMVNTQLHNILDEIALLRNDIALMSALEPVRDQFGNPIAWMPKR